MAASSSQSGSPQFHHIEKVPDQPLLHLPQLPAELYPRQTLSLGGRPRPIQVQPRRPRSEGTLSPRYISPRLRLDSNHLTAVPGHADFGATHSRSTFLSPNRSANSSPTTQSPPRKLRLVDWHSTTLSDEDFSDPTVRYVGEDRVEYEMPQFSQPGDDLRTSRGTSPLSTSHTLPTENILQPSTSDPVSPTASTGEHQDAPTVSSPEHHEAVFNAICQAAPTTEIPAGATVREAQIAASTIFPAFQDFEDRGVIFSFSVKAPSYNHFRIWLESELQQEGILLDDASQLGKYFFVVLLVDRAHQQRTLQLRLFFLNKFVDIIAWVPQFSIHDSLARTAPIWVELSDLHVTLRHKQTIATIAQEMLGHILLIPRTQTLAHHTNPRLLIRWPLAQPPPDFLILKGTQHSLIQKVVFLNHPQGCHCCKRLGHTSDVCPNPPHFPNFRPPPPIIPRPWRPASPSISRAAAPITHPSSPLQAPIDHPTPRPSTSETVSINPDLSSPHIIGPISSASDTVEDLSPAPFSSSFASPLSPTASSTRVPLDFTSTSSIPFQPAIVDNSIASALAKRPTSEPSKSRRWADYSSDSDTDSTSCRSSPENGFPSGAQPPLLPLPFWPVRPSSTHRTVDFHPKQVARRSYCRAPVPAQSLPQMSRYSTPTQSSRDNSE